MEKSDHEMSLLDLIKTVVKSISLNVCRVKMSCYGQMQNVGLSMLPVRAGNGGAFFVSVKPSAVGAHAYYARVSPNVLQAESL